MGKRGNSASRFEARDAEEQRKGQGSDDSDDAENEKGDVELYGCLLYLGC